MWLNSGEKKTKFPQRVGTKTTTTTTGGITAPTPVGSHINRVYPSTLNMGERLGESLFQTLAGRFRGSDFCSANIMHFHPPKRIPCAKCTAALLLKCHPLPKYQLSQNEESTVSLCSDNPSKANARNI